MMPRENIKAQRTYRSRSGRLYYTQDVVGQKVEYVEVGNVERKHEWLNRFAARMVKEERNG